MDEELEAPMVNTIEKPFVLFHICLIVKLPMPYLVYALLN